MTRRMFGQIIAGICGIMVIPRVAEAQFNWATSPLGRLRNYIAAHQCVEKKAHVLLRPATYNSVMDQLANERIYVNYAHAEARACPIVFGCLISKWPDPLLPADICHTVFKPL